MASFILSTDSCADLLKSELKQNNVKYIPLAYIFNGEENRDNYDLDSDYHAFYERLRKGNLPTTAQLNETEMEEYFEKLLLSDTGDIVHVTLSSGMSGTYNNAVAAAKTIMARLPGRRIFVVDSISASQVQGCLVDHAVEDRDKGMTAEETANELAQFAMHLNVIVLASDLFHLHRGGRVSKASAVLGTLFQIKPIIELSRDGKLIVTSKVNGWAKGLRTMAKFILSHAKDLGADTVYIGHADVLNDAKELQRMIEEGGNVKVKTGWIGPVIGSHTGAGTITAICVGAERTVL